MLVRLVRNLKLEVTNYLRELYGLRGVAHPGGGGDDDGGGGEEEDSEATPLITCSHSIYTTNNTQLFLFFFAFKVFFFSPFSRHLSLV